MNGIGLAHVIRLERPLIKTILVSGHENPLDWVQHDAFFPKPYNTMPVTEATPFACPNCGAQYKLVRVETNETRPLVESSPISPGRICHCRCGLRCRSHPRSCSRKRRPSRHPQLSLAIAQISARQTSYAQRHLIKCCFSKLKQFRRVVATRYEKTARN
jgi:uncharacterized Zn-finger protein